MENITANVHTEIANMGSALGQLEYLLQGEPLIPEEPDYVALKARREQIYAEMRILLASLPNQVEAKRFQKPVMRYPIEVVPSMSTCL